MDSKWLPQYGRGIKLWKELPNGGPKVTLGGPITLVSNAMRNIDQICEGISAFLNMWRSMFDVDPTCDYSRHHEQFIFYWKVVRAALNLPVSAPSFFRSGFSPTSRYVHSKEDLF